MTDNLLSSMLRELTDLKTTGAISPDEYEALKLLVAEIYGESNQPKPG
jgi:hypothetical protein